ncbi:MAG TPA: hypothetical protein P5274_00540 [Candidatus Paceibacterota bacterium]|nr:hypothetical protein [Candidatus Paceibacterota bacterium]
MNYKNITKFFLVAFVFSLILPVTSFAFTAPRLGQSATATSGQAKVGTNLCANLVERLQTRNQDMIGKLGRFETKRTEQLQKVSQNRLTGDEKRLEARTRAEANRETRLDQLEARATTEEQKAAVATFRNTLTSLTETRRQAVDSAVSTYRNSVDGSIATRKTTSETARVALRNAIDSVLSQAKTDCTNGVEIQTIRTNTSNGIKTARQQFAEVVKDLEKTKDGVTEASKIRREAMNKIQAEFKAGYDKAVAELKTAFAQ